MAQFEYQKKQVLSNTANNQKISENRVKELREILSKMNRESKSSEESDANNSTQSLQQMTQIVSGTEWMDIATAEIGQKEKSPGDNARIVEYLHAAGNTSNSDETPWCASFAHWCLNKVGITGAGPVGNSWLNWGQRLNKPMYGAIAVFNTGHVGFVAGEKKNGDLVILHGNWSDKVQLSTYGIPKNDIKEYRFPDGSTPTKELPKY